MNKSEKHFGHTKQHIKHPHNQPLTTLFMV